MIPSSVRIFVCEQPQDMRRSFRVKVMWFEENGYCLLYKRLDRARFSAPSSRTISGKALAILLRGVPTRR